MDPQDDLNAKSGTALPKDAGQFLLGVIPTTSNLLQVLCFSVFFGAAIVVVVRERCMPVISVMETVLELFFKIMAWVMRVASIGAIGAVAFIIGQYGLGSLGTYALLIAACYGAAIVFIGLLFVVAWAYPRVPLWQFIKSPGRNFSWPSARPLPNLCCRAP